MSDQPIEGFPIEVESVPATKPDYRPYTRQAIGKKGWYRGYVENAKGEIVWRGEVRRKRLEAQEDAVRVWERMR